MQTHCHIELNLNPPHPTTHLDNWQPRTPQHPWPQSFSQAPPPSIPPPHKHFLSLNNPSTHLNIHFSQPSTASLILQTVPTTFLQPAPHPWNPPQQPIHPTCIPIYPNLPQYSSLYIWHNTHPCLKPASTRKPFQPQSPQYITVPPPRTTNSGPNVLWHSSIQAAITPHLATTKSHVCHNKKLLKLVSYSCMLCNYPMD